MASQDVRGQTALHSACEMGHVEVVHALVGGDFNATADRHLGACRIGRRGFDEGYGWAMQAHELRTHAEEETRLCISDGSP